MSNDFNFEPPPGPPPRKRPARKVWWVEVGWGLLGLVVVVFGLLLVASIFDGCSEKHIYIHVR